MRWSMALIAALCLLVGCSKPNSSTEAKSKSVEHKTASVPASAKAKSPEGPFGIGMGADPDALGGQSMGKPTFYKITSPPRPHPEFEFVVVQAAPKVGVCWVKGVGRNIDTDDFGIAARRHVDDIEVALESKYGKPKKKDDFLLSGSLWTGERYWMMGLQKGERAYAYVWEKPQPEGDIWKDLSDIYLGASAVSGQQAYVVVEYTFKNKKQCEDAAKKVAADAL